MPAARSIEFLSFHGACRDAFDDMLLAEDIDDDDGDQVQHDTGHHGSHGYLAVAAPGGVLLGDCHKV